MVSNANSVGHGVSVWLELEAIQEDPGKSNKESP